MYPKLEENIHPHKESRAKNKSKLYRLKICMSLTYRLSITTLLQKGTIQLRSVS